MSQGKSKKGKTKGKTLNLSEFLSDYKAPEGFRVVSTTGILDNDNVRFSNDARNRDGTIILPTAPKSARAPSVDLTKVPTEPPYKAFLGNLPYDVNKDEVIRFFKRVQVKNVTFPGLKPRGIACAEFDDRSSLIEAIGQNGDSLKGRTVRVYVSHDSEGGERGGKQDERDDRTSGDWRSNSGDWRSNSGGGGPPTWPFNTNDNDGGRRRQNFDRGNFGGNSQSRFGNRDFNRNERDFNRNERINDEKLSDFRRGNRDTGPNNYLRDGRSFGSFSDRRDFNPYSERRDDRREFIQHSNRNRESNPYSNMREFSSSSERQKYSSND